MGKRITFETTSASLHIMAMLFMLCDHLWGTIVPGNDWLTCVGRITFPIFAFLIVEGYFHTSSLKKYMGRLLVFALLSEIPFNLAMGSRVFYPIHQNVLWSFLISLLLISWNERVKNSGKLWKQVTVGGISIVLGAVLGLLTMVDYYHAGVLTVLTFYFFRGKKWWNYIAQLFCLWYINMEMLGGFGYEVALFGKTFFFMRQGLALLALIPIWLYKGERGHQSRAFRWFCYAFYPVHLLVLGFLKLYI